jgi:hypothetical protein
MYSGAGVCGSGLSCTCCRGWKSDAVCYAGSCCHADSTQPGGFCCQTGPGPICPN